MSGGIDSNSLIAIAKRILNCNVHGFTVKQSDIRYEETELVNQSVKELGIDHTYIELRKIDFLKNLKELINYHDSPVYTITYFIQWRLMQNIASKGYKVSISGTGADELFSGYYDHHNLYLADVKNDIPIYTQSKKNWQKYISPIVRNPYLKILICL